MTNPLIFPVSFWNWFRDMGAPNDGYIYFNNLHGELVPSGQESGNRLSETRAEIEALQAQVSSIEAQLAATAATATTAKTTADEAKSTATSAAVAAGASEALSYTDTNGAADNNVEITHGPGGTSNGNDITVTLSLAYSVTGTQSTQPASGAISASAPLTRDKAGGGAAATGTTLSLSGTRSVVYIDAVPPYWRWTESLSGSVEYTDPDNDTDERVYAATCTLTDTLGSLPEGALKITSVEEA